MRAWWVCHWLAFLCAKPGQSLSFSLPALISLFGACLLLASNGLQGKEVFEDFGVFDSRL